MQRGCAASTLKAALLTGLSVLCGVLLACGQMLAAERVAIVIGNADYRSKRLADLPNAANDAAAVAEALRKNGFSVIPARNVTAAGFAGLLAQAAAQKPAEAILLFYAGHALMAGGETFLLPADTPEPTSLEALTAAAVRSSDIAKRFSDPERPTLLFIDACSEGPSGNTGASQDWGDNLFLAVASQPGSPAWDGAAGSHSPFTGAFLQALAVPGLSLTGIMDRTRTETARLSLGRQQPWSRSTLHREFFFKAPGGAAPPAD